MNITDHRHRGLQFFADLLAANDMLDVAIDTIEAMLDLRLLCADDVTDHETVEYWTIWTAW